MPATREKPVEPAYRVVYRNPRGLTRYEYECRDCHKSQIELHSAQDAPVIKCESCGSENTYRVLRTCTFHLKGRGFPSKEIKIDREIQKQDEIMAEGWRSQSEINEAGHMLKERNERLVKEGQKVLPDADQRGGKKIGTEGLKTAAKKQRDRVNRK